MGLHAPTDDERYLAQPRPAPVILTALGWTLGALAAALLVTLDSPLRERALALYTGTFGNGAGDTAATVRVTGIVVIGLCGLLVGLGASFMTDLLFGVPKRGLRVGLVLVLVLWTASVLPFALLGFPFAVPLVAALYGWMRAGGFSPSGQRIQAIVWLVISGAGVAGIGFLMAVRPDLATVIRFG